MNGRQNCKSFSQTIGMAISNIINQVVFGRRLEYSDPDFVGLENFDPYFAAKLKSSLLPFYQVCKPRGLSLVNVCLIWISGGVANVGGFY